MPRTPTAATSFTPETFLFLTDLAAHNERPWFAANKHRYEQHVLAPALAFIETIAPAIHGISRHFVASKRRVGGSLMRVYRDTRFARDKAPFKTNIGIQFRHERAKDVHAPGFYVHAEPGGCFLGAGIWHPEPSALKAIRREIVEQPKLWQSSRDARSLRRHFELGGRQLTQAPRGFPRDAPHAEDLKRQDFIASCTLAERDVLRGDFAAHVAERFAATTPFMEFLCGALDLAF
jgi:uncharacterized protein (TIGR02453 family)